MNSVSRWALPLLVGLGVAVGFVACAGEEFTSAPTGSGAAGGSGGAGGVGGEGATTGGSGGGPVCVDGDADGVTDCEGDCDDAEPTVHPGAPEVCGDGVDNACGDDPDPFAACGGIGTYVSALIGDDGYAGTQAEPVRTIAAGIAKAQSLLFAQPVFVAEGGYAEDVTLADGLVLLGGHHCASGDCPWTRDPGQYTSTIYDQDADGIFADHTVSRATLVEGFRIEGLGGNPGTAAYAALTMQGSAILRGNYIAGGAVAGCGWQCGTVAVLVTGAPSNGPGTLIESNAIFGGSAGDGATHAVRVTNAGAAEITGNDIRGATGGFTRAVVVDATAGSTVIHGNDIHAGSCNSTGATFAVHVGTGAAPLIDGNRVNVDPQKTGTCPSYAGTWWTGGIESEGSVATITNNVVRGVSAPRSVAVLLADCEGACQLGQAIVDANTLDGAGMAPAGNATLSAAIAFKTWKAGQNVVVGRVRNNILLAGQGQQAFGGYEDVGVVGSSCRPQLLANNDIWGTTTLYQLWNGASAVVLDTVGLVDALPGASGHANVDPELDATFHLAPGSPCIDAGTSAPGETPSVDIDGDPRPQGAQVDIGADEAG